MEMPSLHDVSEFIIAIGVLATAVRSFLNGTKLEQIHKATNSLTDRLVETTAKKSDAEGFARGQKQEHD